jgi:hypothetical protein
VRAPPAPETSHLTLLELGHALFLHLKLVEQYCALPILLNHLIGHALDCLDLLLDDCLVLLLDRLTFKIYHLMCDAQPLPRRHQLMLDTN